MAKAPDEFPRNPQRLTPFQNFRYKIKWPDAAGKMTYVAAASRISRMSRSTEVIKHRGGHPSVEHMQPGQTIFGPITLERGVFYDPAFEEWANKIFDLTFTSDAAADNPPDWGFRKDLVIEVYNEAGQAVLAYTVHGAWLSDFWAILDLDTNGEAMMLIQSMTMENEGWEKAVVEAR